MILVLNSGSSSVKFRLVDLHDPFGRGAQAGTVERIGEPGGVADHAEALRRIFAQLALAPGRLRAVGHRVVHGGARFVAPVVVDKQVLAALRELVPLAPLHNAGSIAGIEAARTVFDGVVQVAVFDTAFHLTLPAAAAGYAIDADVARRLGIRRFGFHGISHRYVAAQTARLLGQPLEQLHLIVLHLGNGASATAIRCGQSVETSMGFTPLEGLVMGTRCGDLDPAVPLHLQRAGGLTVDEVDQLLQHRSGLAGLCGEADMRAVLTRRAAGDATAALAFDIYCHRILKYIGAYHAVLGRLDAIAFTAGVGEHSAEVRAACLDGLSSWGIAVDPERNLGTDDIDTGDIGTGDIDGGHTARTRRISPEGAPVAVCVVPTNEELAIGEEVAHLLGDAGPAYNIGDRRL